MSSIVGVFMSKMKYLLCVSISLLGIACSANSPQEPLSWRELFAMAEPTEKALCISPLAPDSIKYSAQTCAESAGVGFGSLSILKHWEEMQLLEIQTLLANEDQELSAIF